MITRHTGWRQLAQIQSGVNMMMARMSAQRPLPAAPKLQMGFQTTPKPVYRVPVRQSPYVGKGVAITDIPPPTPRTTPPGPVNAVSYLHIRPSRDW